MAQSRNRESRNQIPTVKNRIQVNTTVIKLCCILVFLLDSDSIDMASVLESEFKSEFHACSIEAIPYGQLNHGLYYCGTYELNEETQTRNGT